MSISSDVVTEHTVSSVSSVVTTNLVDLDYSSIGVLRPIGISYFVLEQFNFHLEPMNIHKAKPVTKLCNFAVRKRIVFSHFINSEHLYICS